MTEKREEQIVSVCGNITLPVNEDTLILSLRKLSADLDQERFKWRDICEPAAKTMAIAWCLVENAIRELTGSCSQGGELPAPWDRSEICLKRDSDGRPSCGACSEYVRLHRINYQLRKLLAHV